MRSSCGELVGWGPDLLACVVDEFRGPATPPRAGGGASGVLGNCFDGSDVSAPVCSPGRGVISFAAEYITIAKRM